MSGGGSDYFPKPRELEKLLGQAEATGQARQLDADVNGLLQEILAKANQRAPEKTNEYLDELRKAISSEVKIEQLLLAGSVAKNTYVDELSDIDALAVIDRKDLQDKNPQEVLTVFYKLLKTEITADNMASIKKGDMAITVKYRDGTEIQLLPALRSGNKVSVPNADQSGWNETSPKVFQRALTQSNQTLDGSLVPTIKLMKRMMANLPREKQLTGYHYEALALDAAKNYSGPNTPKSLLLHVLDSASKRVMQPIQDTTGQSRTVDKYMEGAGSLKRRIASDALAGLARRLGAATTVEQWRRIVEGR